MSKIFCSLLALFALISCGDNTETPTPQPQKSAPQLALSYQGKVYPSGSTIEVAASERTFDYAPGQVEVKAGDDNDQFPSPSPVIVLNAAGMVGHGVGSGNAASAKFPKNYTATVTATDFARFTWCGVDTQCMPMAKATETRQGTITKERPQAPLLLECSFAPQQYATVVATVRLQASGETQAATYTLRFVYAKK